MPNYVVIGGAAGGATLAAQLRRLQPSSRIDVIEQGSIVSAANCGLVYALGGVIRDASGLISQTPEYLAKRLGLNLRMRHQALAIDRAAHSVRVRNLETGDLVDFCYDKLFLATRSTPAAPPIPGVDHAGVFPLRTFPHLESALEWIAQHSPRTALVLGGGFLGLEVAENLAKRGLDVTLVERSPQVMPMLDRELSTLVHRHAMRAGISLRLDSEPVAIESCGNQQLRVRLSEGAPIAADMVMLTMGANPDVALASAAGLRLGSLGGVEVDENLRTSDPDVYCVGDAIETRHRITGGRLLTSLSVPLILQARLSAMHATGHDEAYKGTLNTFICPFMGLQIAGTGASERDLQAAGLAYEKVLLPGTQHAPFYPGAQEIHLKLLFAPDSGRLLGAQAVGMAGVDKRIDVLATALAAGMTVRDLEMLELAYSPPFNSHRDPINVAGGVAASMLQGRMRGIHPDQVEAHMRGQAAVLLDTRSLEEHQLGAIPGSLHIPADELADRSGEIPSTSVVVYCQIGSKSTSAQKLLNQKGFMCLNLLGGYKAWQLYFPSKSAPAPCAPTASPAIVVDPPSQPSKATAVLDATGLTCPGPIVAVAKKAKGMRPGETLEIWVNDPTFLEDLPAWARARGYEVSPPDHSHSPQIRLVLSL